MKYYIHFILVVIAQILTLAGVILLLTSIFAAGRHEWLNMPYFYGGLAALVNAAILYGYAYIVKACVIYSEKFAAEYSKGGLNDEPEQVDE